ncbi:MAG TPA: LacI family DNA-binding transcriptional regulator [Spirochaetia bacterium]|nr:LacI family DNA-binding transcriptional regulator [Spirochaetia bacterium]
MATIYDVARESGYSPTVVSHALNNNPRVSEKARAAVLVAAKRLHYRPNLLARELGLNKTKLIGIIVRDIIYPFYPSIVEGIEETAFSHGYTTILCNSAGSIEREAIYLDVLTRRKAAGIIVGPVQSGPDNTVLFQELKESGVPIVFVDGNLKRVKTDFILTDGVKGAYKAVRHLVELGHNRIGCVEPASGEPNRLAGYRKALEDSHIDFREEYVARRKGDRGDQGKIGNEVDGYEGTRQLLQLRYPPTAIFAINDVMAFGAEKAIREFGLRIPADISLVGFDDVLFSSFLGVPLTTVKQPTHAIGRTAATILISRIEQQGRQKRRRHISIEPDLVVRESTGPAPRKARRRAQGSRYPSS